MTRLCSGIAAVALLSSSAFGQSATPFKSYKTQEDYCRDNPRMPTCIDVRPIGDLQTLYKSPKLAVKPAVRPEPTQAERTVLQDWRFSHTSPAMLISINIGSLLRSPLLAALLAGTPSAEIEKARAALSDLGQVLISVGPSGTSTPSVLILAKGDLDGAFGSILRSGSGMQSKRLDAITMLIGDAVSLERATLRLRGSIPRTTINTLQQTATKEALKYDAWVGIDPSHMVTVMSALGAPLTPQTRSLGNLRGLSAGLYLRDQIRMEAALDAPSPELAERMLAAFEKNSKSQGEQVWVSAEGAKLRYIEIVEGSRVNAMTGLDTIAPKMVPLIRALAASEVTRQPAAAPTAKPAGPIVIQGLAGGPKELPVK